MPLYEYQCDACANRFERIQKFSDPPVDSCPSCGGAVRKLLSSPAIQFKGSGWYITDYAKKPASKGDDTKSAAASPSSDGDSGSSSKSSTTSGTTESASAGAKSSEAAPQSQKG